MMNWFVFLNPDVHRQTLRALAESIRIPPVPMVSFQPPGEEPMPPKFYSPNEPTPAPYLERERVLDEPRDPFPEEPPTTPDTPQALAGHPYRDSTMRPPSATSVGSMKAVREHAADLDTLRSPDGLPDMRPRPWWVRVVLWLLGP